MPKGKTHRDAGASVPQMITHVLHWLQQALAARAQLTRMAWQPAGAGATVTSDLGDAAYSEDEDVDPIPTPGQQAVHQALQRLLALAGTAGLSLESALRVTLALLSDELATVFFREAGMSVEELCTELDEGLLSGMTSYVWKMLSAGAP